MPISSSDAHATLRTVDKHSTWLTRFAPRPTATMRLICFSHAGGGAAVYRPWALSMPAAVEVMAIVLPGREGRVHETPLPAMSMLLEELIPALLPHLDRPFAFFGHSMGALVAFETARALQRHGASLPIRLLLSGRRAPHLPEQEPPLHQLQNDEFLAEINNRHGGIPVAVLQHRDLLALLLPGLRADMTVIETYRHDGGPGFSGPISVFGGMDDARARRDQLLAWQQHTAHPLTLRMFAGGHFYFNEPQARDALIATVAAALDFERAFA